MQELAAETDRCGKSVYRRIFTGSEIPALHEAKGAGHDVSSAPALWEGRRRHTCPDLWLDKHLSHVMY